MDYWRRKRVMLLNEYLFNLRETSDTSNPVDMNRNI